MVQKILSLRSTPTALRLKRHSLKASQIWSVKRKNVQITDVSDVKVQTTMQRAMGRRRLLGNIRGIMPSSAPAEAKQIEIRFKIFTSNPQSASSNLASKMPLLATDYGFKDECFVGKCSRTN